MDAQYVLGVFLLLSLTKPIYSEVREGKYGEYCDRTHVICEASNILANYECIDNTCSCPQPPNAYKGLTYEKIGDWEGCYLIPGSKCPVKKEKDLIDETTLEKCVKNAQCINSVCTCDSGATCTRSVTPPSKATKPDDISKPLDLSEYDIKELGNIPKEDANGGGEGGSGKGGKGGDSSSSLNKCHPWITVVVMTSIFVAILHKMDSCFQ